MQTAPQIKIAKTHNMQKNTTEPAKIGKCQNYCLNNQWVNFGLQREMCRFFEFLQ